MISDILRRADILVTVAKVTLDPAETPILQWQSVQSLKFIADARFEDIIDKKWDVIIVPGGKVAPLTNSKVYLDRIKWQKADNRILAAIGEGSSLVLIKNNLLEDEKATTNPEYVPNDDKVLWQDASLVVSGKMITARTQGSSLELAMKIGEILVGKKKMDEVKHGMLL